MKLKLGKDEWTPALKKALKNGGAASREATLKILAWQLKRELQNTYRKELTYDGKPMRSPATRTRLGGRFAASYLFRYPPKSFRHLSKAEKRTFKATGKVGTRGLTAGSGFVGGELKKVAKIRRRIPVTAASRQLQYTGATLKSLDILSAGPDTTRVGPKTSHGNKILSFHNPTRRVIGISKKYAGWAAKTALKRLTKGV